MRSIGAHLWVEEGRAHGDQAWVCTSNAGGTLGTTAITWVQFGGTGAYQPLDSDLTAIAALTTTSYGRGLLTAASAAVLIASLGAAPVLNPAFSGYLDMAEIAAPGTPGAGNSRLYVKSDGKLYVKDEAGVETQVGSGSGGTDVGFVNAASPPSGYTAVVGDGTTNNTTALQALLNAFTRVYLPKPAVSYLTDALTMNSDNWLFGDGKATVIEYTHASNAGSVFDFTSRINARVTQVCFKVNKVSFSTAIVAVFITCSDCHLKDIYTLGSGRMLAYGYQSTDCSVRDVHIDGSAGSGSAGNVVQFQQCTKCVIDSIYVPDGTLMAESIIVMETGSYNRVTNCYIKKATNGMFGVHFFNEKYSLMAPSTGPRTPGAKAWPCAVRTTLAPSMRSPSQR